MALLAFVLATCSLCVSGTDIVVDGVDAEWLQIRTWWTGTGDVDLVAKWYANYEYVWILLQGSIVDELTADCSLELRFRPMRHSSTDFSVAVCQEGQCALYREQWSSRSRTPVDGLEATLGTVLELRIPLEEIRRSWGAQQVKVTLKLSGDAGTTLVSPLPLLHFRSPAVSSSSTAKPAGDSAREAEEAARIHEVAWHKTATMSGMDRFYKFSIYTSRTIAVAHPEIYLQGDALFLGHISSQSGFAAAYAECDPHTQRYCSGHEGGPFTWGLVDLAGLACLPAIELLPDGAPFLPVLDTRVLPVASNLKTQGKPITQLEKAMLLYFKRKAEGTVNQFIVYCTNENTYLATPESLFAVGAWSDVGSIDGDVMIVWNEDAVWYPLMDRDDRQTHLQLRDIAALYDIAAVMPPLLPFEQEIVAQLKATTALTTTIDREIATLASMRGLPHHGGDIQRLSERIDGDGVAGFTRGRLHRANYLSPVAAYLAAIAGSEHASASIERMVSIWNTDFGCAHGHIWRCGLVDYTIDEVYRIQFVHCELHAECLSAVLDLAGVGNYVIKAAPRAVLAQLHSTVAIPSLGWVISNGAITDRQTVLNRDPRSGPLDVLLYISRGETWAKTTANSFLGNWAPGDLARTLEDMQAMYGDEIHGFGSFESFVASEDFLATLHELNGHWRPMEHP